MPMPRFTYQPSCNSRPARSAIWLRSHILRFLLASRAVFDALFVFALNDAVHIDARQVDGVGIKAAQRHDFFHLHNADLTGGRGGGGGGGGRGREGGGGGGRGGSGGGGLAGVVSGVGGRNQAAPGAGFLPPQKPSLSGGRRRAG